MATSLTAALSLVLKATYKAKTAGDDMSVPEIVLTKSVTDTLANGEGSGQAEVAYTDTLTGAGPHTVDIYGGITDAFGNTLSIKLLKGVLIHNRSTTTGQYVDVGGSGAGVTFAALTGDTDEIRVHPDGVLFLWAPMATPDSYVAGAGTDDTILITAGAGSPSIDIMLIGCV